MPAGTLKHRIVSGRFTAEEILDLGLRVAALAATHGKGIVHRDVKPASIFAGQSVGGAQGDQLSIRSANDLMAVLA